MKKFYTFLLGTTIFCSVSHAQKTPDMQFKKGDKLLGGGLSYSLQRNTYNYTSVNNTNSDDRYYSVGIYPSLGFFTKPNQLTGVSLLFSYASNSPSNNTNGYVQKSHNYGVSFYRQYWNSLGKNFYFNIQGQVGSNYGSSRYNYTSQKDDVKNVNAYFSIDPGFAYRIKKKLVLDMYYTNFLSTSFGYSEARRNDYLISRSYGLGASTGLQNFSLNNVVFGFRYVL